MEINSQVSTPATMKTNVPVPGRNPIESARDNLETLSHEKRCVEATTRTCILERTLKQAGYDVADPRQVEIEASTGCGGRTDYVLHAGKDRQAVMTIEAKPLGSNLDDLRTIRQALHDCIDLGIALCMVTDGNQYDLYFIPSVTSLPKEPLCRAHLNDKNFPDFLRMISPSALSSGGLLEAAKKEMDMRCLVDWVMKLLATGCPGILKAIAAAYRRVTGKAISCGEALSALKRLKIGVTPGFPSFIPVQRPPKRHRRAGAPGSRRMTRKPLKAKQYKARALTEALLEELRLRCPELSNGGRENGVVWLKVARTKVAGIKRGRMSVAVLVRDASVDGAEIEPNESQKSIQSPLGAKHPRDFHYMYKVHDPQEALLVATLIARVTKALD